MKNWTRTEQILLLILLQLALLVGMAIGEQVSKIIF